MFGRYYPDKVTQSVLAMKRDCKHRLCSWADLARKALTEQGVQATDEIVRTVADRVINLSGRRRLH